MSKYDISVHEECGYVQTGISYEEIKSYVVHFNNSNYEYDDKYFNNVKVGSEIIFYSQEDDTFIRHVKPKLVTVLSIIHTNKDILFVVDKKVVLPRRKWYIMYILHSSLKESYIVNHPDSSIDICTTYKSCKISDINSIVKLPDVIAEQERLLNFKESIDDHRHRPWWRQ